jgi:polyisoprenoid-binding protein YceI
LSNDHSSAPVARQARRVALSIAAATLSAAVLSIHATSAQDAASPAPSPAPSTPAAVSADPAATAAPSQAVAPEGGIDGTWSIDTSIGDFSDFSSPWVGFRVAEVLDLIGEAEAVGRTPAVSGELQVSGTTIDSAVIEADLTAIRSDQSRRDPAIQRALETTDFPTATFVSGGPVDLGALPVENEPFVVAMPGTLTIHGVPQDVTLELTAQRVGDVVAVVGTLPVDFTAFGVEMPTAPVVVSVEDTGHLEWLLFFRRS